MNLKTEIIELAQDLIIVTLLIPLLTLYVRFILYPLFKEILKDDK